MIKVKRSQTAGRGCFTNEIIPKNSYILTTSTRGPDSKSGFYYLRFLNHSCKPNCGFLAGKSMFSDVLYSKKRIREKEELTINYKGTRWEHLMFGKKCGCKKCASVAQGN